MPPQTSLKAQNFSENLRNICACRPSISAICRDIGINRQQFERYLTGASVPSPYNLRRICLYFGVEEAHLLGAGTEMVLAQQVMPPDGPQRLSQALRPEETELAALRNYLGFYHYYFHTPSWPGQIQCGLLQIYENQRDIRTRYIGRVRDPDYHRIIRSRFEGQAVLRGDRIFILEYARGEADSFGQSILYAAHRHQANYLTGMAFGIGWHPHRGPFASQLILRRLRSATTLRKAIGQCGLYGPDSRNLDPIVRNHFGQQTQPFMIG